MHNVPIKDFYEAMDQAYYETYNSLNSYPKKAFLRASVSLASKCDRSIGFTFDISFLENASDAELLSIRNVEPEFIITIRRAIDILNGAPPIKDTNYTITLSGYDAYVLNKILKNKYNEIDALTKLLSNFDRLQY